MLHCLHRTGLLSRLPSHCFFKVNFPPTKLRKAVLALSSIAFVVGIDWHSLTTTAPSRIRISVGARVRVGVGVWVEVGVRVEFRIEVMVEFRIGIMVGVRVGVRFRIRIRVGVKVKVSTRVRLWKKGKTQSTPSPY